MKVKRIEDNVFELELEPEELRAWESVAKHIGHTITRFVFLLLASGIAHSIILLKRKG